jgi:hypothetical protein
LRKVPFLQDLLRGVAKVGLTFLKDHIPAYEPDSSGREQGPVAVASAVSKWGVFAKSACWTSYGREIANLRIDLVENI